MMEIKKSSYQITRYLNANQKINLSNIYKFIIRYHWRIKEDFDILKRHGKNSVEYFDRKSIAVPGLNERISYIESFILLYYLYAKIWEERLNPVTRDPNSTIFWNVLFKEDNITLSLIENFYKNYAYLLPNIFNTETRHENLSSNISVQSQYLKKTDVSKFFDRNSSTLTINTFKSFMLCDEDTLYMVHRLSNPYKFTRTIYVTKHDIFTDSQSLLKTFVIPKDYYLYDAFIFEENERKYIKFIVKKIDNNEYKYAVLDLTTEDLSNFHALNYAIFGNEMVEESLQIWNKHRAVVTSDQNCNFLKLYILTDDLKHRETYIPLTLYDKNTDPYTIQYFLSDEFVFLLNWTKLSYGIYRIYSDTWEGGYFEVPTTFKDLKVLLFPDTKNKVKVLVNFECGIRASLNFATEKTDESLYEEGLVLEETQSEQGNIVNINFEENYGSEGLVIVKSVDREWMEHLCGNLAPIGHGHFLQIIKEYMETLCEKIGTLYKWNTFAWLNEFSPNLTKVYEIEVPRDSQHIKTELENKNYYIDLAKNIFSKHLLIVPALWSSKSFINSYGTAIQIYESFKLYRISRFYSKMEQIANMYIQSPPYNCRNPNLQKNTIRRLVCAYKEKFLEYFVFNNSGRETLNDTIIKNNPEIIDQNYDIFYSFSNLERLREHIIPYFMPNIYSQLNEINWENTLNSLLLSLAQHLGTDASILSIFGMETVARLIELMLLTFFPIHSQIVQGYAEVRFDEKTPNFLAIYDFFLSIQNVDIYDFISISDFGKATM